MFYESVYVVIVVQDIISDMHRVDAKRAAYTRVITQNKPMYTLVKKCVRGDEKGLCRMHSNYYVGVSLDYSTKQT